MIDVTEEKSRLRRRFREARLSRYSEDQVLENDMPNFLHLMDIPEIRGANVVTSYFSIKDEPNTVHFNRALIEAGKILLLPRVAHPNLEWVSWSGDPAMLTQNRGLFEPRGPAIAELSIIDAVIVPALCVDYEGYRIGQGGGYYDRSLPSMSGWKVGIVYAEEITANPLPREDHDVRIAAVATPTEVIRFS